MTNTIQRFYRRLGHLPDIVELVIGSFPDDAAAILQAMKAGKNPGHEGEELEGVLTDFITDHAEVVTSFKGLGGSDDSSREAMAYFEAHHPEVHHLLHTQAQELEELLGKDGAAIALGQTREPFDIDVMNWKGIYVVRAEEFETAWFADEQEAITFAESNYETFIKTAGQ